MEKPYSNTGLWLVIAALCLLVGVTIGAMAFAIETTVPIPTEKRVEVPVKVEVPVRTNYVEEGVKIFLNKLETDDFDKYLICSKERYEPEQVSLSKVYEGARIDLSKTDTDDKLNADKSISTFEVRLKFADEQVQSKCYKDFDVEVREIEGEETIVKIK